MVSKQRNRKTGKTLEQQILDYIMYWADYLRLNDWDFEVSILEDNSEAMAACVTHYPHIQLARIEVLDPSKIVASWPGVRDVEVSVVHELLHVRFYYSERTSKKANTHEEMAIETLAQALVALKRGILPEDLV